MLEAIGKVARERQQALLAALPEGEQSALAGFFLQRVADQRGLTRGVHPGFGKQGAVKEFQKHE
jgi:hypothetical protein